jgi:hypothetical protein
VMSQQMSRIGKRTQPWVRELNSLTPGGEGTRDHLKLVSI